MKIAKQKVHYVCGQCGAFSAKWTGKCLSCGAWDSFSEEAIAPQNSNVIAGHSSLSRGVKINFSKLDGKIEHRPRRKTQMDEFDRAIGGGLVSGSVILLGGDPGIGKSTLLMQISASISREMNCYYVSGEESVDQLRLRAKRLGLNETKVNLASESSVRDIITTMVETENVDVVIIDSIQTMVVDTIDSLPGSVSQIKVATQELVRAAKRCGFVLIIVGHVTKEGQLAGPKLLEHMVDTVLYFEGERNHHFRILRSVKNRFGGVDEIGVFEMTDDGLKEVANPSMLFLSSRDNKVNGSCVFAGIEGSRPLLVEIQSLLANSNYGNPRRAVVGADVNRLAMIIAVLEARCGLQFYNQDIYLNVAGGLKIIEPALDLAVAAALVSSLLGKIIPDNVIFCGEIGLSGEVRSVSRLDVRIKEATRLGFKKAIVPNFQKGVKVNNEKYNEGIDLHFVASVNDLLLLFQHELI